MDQKKYILKPGKHQFAPGEHARHDNENLTDAEAKWYLVAYPHIKSLFSNIPEVEAADKPNLQPSRGKRKRIRVITPETCETPEK